MATDVRHMPPHATPPEPGPEEEIHLRGKVSSALLAFGAIFLMLAAGILAVIYYM